MSTQHFSGRQRGSLLEALKTQARVIGALIMRELHTRYGRENIGYLWLIGEPVMLASVIATLHSGNHTQEGGINPIAFTVTGYTNFIMFRGIVNRSEGALVANGPLLYHRMVTVFDIALSRAILEVASTSAAFFVMYSFCLAAGFAELPVRPLMMLAGIAYIFWFSLSLSLIIIGGTYERSLFERLVHPFTYFMIPLSGAFFQVSWIPRPYRDYLLYNPFVHCFEMLRYGVFEAATPDYFDVQYLTFSCLILTFFGLLCIRSVKTRIRL